MYDIIIIGGGPAGLTAGIYARRANKSVLVIEKCERIYSILKLGKFWQTHVGSSAVGKKRKQRCCSKVIYNVR